MLKSPRIVIFTGVGLSRESGFAPFDPAAMPPGVTLQDVVTRDGFERDPATVQDFYNRRRRELTERIAPSPAHDALAVLSMTNRGEALIVTRNIDDLHERAGSGTVIHTHGELLKARCTICTHTSDRLGDIAPDTECPICGNPGHLRPHIVWVGQEPLQIPLIFEALANCQIFAAIGAAGGSEPARSFLAEARRARATTIEFSGEDQPLAEVVPAWVKSVIAG